MNIYGAKKTPYFQMQFAASDALPRISGNAAKVILLLAATAHRHNAVELELSQSDISSGTGIKDRKTINKALGELETAGLVRVRPSPAGVLSYMLLDAATRQPLPKPERYSGVLRYRRAESKTAKQETVADVAATRPDESKPTPIPSSTRSKLPSGRIVPAHRTLQPAVFCKIHPNGSTWQLPDGTLRCEGCYPNPQAARPSGRQPTGAELFG